METAVSEHDRILLVSKRRDPLGDYWIRFRAVDWAVIPTSVIYGAMARLLRPGQEMATKVSAYVAEQLLPSEGELISQEGIAKLLP